jgi:uncharacterized membrane protein
MTQNDQPAATHSSLIQPDAGSCYSHGWRQMWKYFLELLLITIIGFVLTVPSWGLSAFKETDWPVAFPMFMFALVYCVLFLWPLEYGVSFAFLKATRGDRVEVQDMFEVFKCWINAILAQLLTGFIIGIGFMFFIIPGIVFACKFAFVPFLIVDRKLDVVDAVQTSWRMTTGHAFTVFLIGFIGFFLAIAGLVCFFVGVIIAGIWIELAFACLYYSVAGKETVRSA